MTMALAVARRERHGGRKAADQDVAADAADLGLARVDRHAAVADHNRIRTDRDAALHDCAEAMVLAKEAAAVELQAARLRRIAEPEIAEVEPAGLALGPARRPVRCDRAIGVPQRSRGGVEIAAGI